MRQCSLGKLRVQFLHGHFCKYVLSRFKQLPHDINFYLSPNQVVVVSDADEHASVEQRGAENIMLGQKSFKCR